MSHYYCADCGRLERAGSKECPACRGDRELYCPDCGSDIKADDNRCSYCGIPLFTDAEAREEEKRRKLIEIEEQNKLVCVKEAANRIEADFTSGLLDSFGVWSMIKADDCAGMRPHMLLAFPVQIFVRRADVEKAEQILSEVSEPKFPE